MTKATNFDLGRDLLDLYHELEKGLSVQTNRISSETRSTSERFVCIRLRSAYCRFVDAALWCSVSTSDEKAFREGLEAAAGFITYDARALESIRKLTKCFNDFIATDRRVWNNETNFSIRPS